MHLILLQYDNYYNFVELLNLYYFYIVIIINCYKLVLLYKMVIISDINLYDRYFNNINIIFYLFNFIRMG
jgi:hypothetical protein